MVLVSTPVGPRPVYDSDVVYIIFYNYLVHLSVYEDEEEPDDVPDDDLCWVIVDAKRQCETQKEKLKFDAC